MLSNKVCNLLLAPLISIIFILAILVPTSAASLIPTTTTVTSSANPSISGHSVTFTATINPFSPLATPASLPYPTGTVTFYEELSLPVSLSSATSMPPTYLLRTETLVSGQAVCTTSDLSTGSHIITAVYNGDSQFDISSGSLVEQITNNLSMTTTTVNSTANPSVFGQPLTFTAIVNPLRPTSTTASLSYPTGTVTFYDVLLLSPGPVSGTPSMASVSKVLGTKTLISGQATLTTSALLGGSHNVTAVYSGDIQYAGSAGSVVQQIVDNVLSTITTATSSTNPSVFHQPVTFTATVNPVSQKATPASLPYPTGTVTFYEGLFLPGPVTGTPPVPPVHLLGTESLISGQATYTTSDLSVGSHIITAVYSGDSQFDVSSGSLVEQITNNLSMTTTTVNSTANPSVFGQSLTFTATVNPLRPTATTASLSYPTGTVTFYDVLLLSPGPVSGTPSMASVSKVLGTKTLISGQATLTTSALLGGSHNVTAVYSGDIQYAGSAGSVVQQIVDDVSSTTTTVTSSANPSVFHQPITFTATVIGTSSIGTPTGIVYFYDSVAPGPIPGRPLPLVVRLLGTGTLKSGQVTCTTTNFWAGSHKIMAVYRGDTNFRGSTGSVIQVVVADTAGNVTTTTNGPVTLFGSPQTNATSLLSDGTLGIAYSQTLEVSGGIGPYTWSVKSGSLPSGLSLSPSGAIIGTPTATGDFSVTIDVTDSAVPANTTSQVIVINTNFIPGDANGDGVVNVGDITKEERIILGLDPPTPGANVNLNGAIDMGAVVSMERTILGLP